MDVVRLEGLRTSTSRICGGSTATGNRNAVIASSVASIAAGLVDFFQHLKLLNGSWPRFSYLVSLPGTLRVSSPTMRLPPRTCCRMAAEHSYKQQHVMAQPLFFISSPLSSRLPCLPPIAGDIGGTNSRFVLFEVGVKLSS